MKNFKIGVKLYVGFGIVLMMVIVLGIFWQRGIVAQSKIDNEKSKLLELSEQLRHMQLKHYQWVDDLRNTYRAKGHFTGQLDPTQCAFGKWYYSYKCPDELKVVFASLDEPHRKLHETGAEASNELDRGNYAAADKTSLIVREKLLPELMSFYNPFMDAIGKEAEKHKIEANNSIKAQRAASFIIMGISLLCVIFLGFFLSRTISKPINKVASMLKDIAQGEGDLTKSLNVDSSDEIGELAKWFNMFIDKLNDIIYRVANATAQIASSTQQLAATSEEMAAGSEEQTSRTLQVATSMEEMSATVQQVAANSSAAADKARGAGEKAGKGGEVVSQTVSGMNKIAQSVRELQEVIKGLAKNSEKIGDIVKVIDDVADQTNLLALNAAIEAARAGEQGRGFAVVADEVRKLAERTTGSTKEIAMMVRSIQEDTTKAAFSMDVSSGEVDAGVKLANQAGQSLVEILSAVKIMQEMVQQIATSAEQQSAAAEEISSNIESIASVSKQNSLSSQQTSMSSQEISKLTEDLHKLVNQFKLKKTVDAQERAGVSATAVSKFEIINGKGNRKVTDVPIRTAGKAANRAQTKI